MSDEIRDRFSGDTRDRVIALEGHVRNLEQDFVTMCRKVDEMHALLMQARGAKWVIVGSAALAGTVASILFKLIPWSFPFR